MQQFCHLPSDPHPALPGLSEGQGLFSFSSIWGELGPLSVSKAQLMGWQNSRGRRPPTASWCTFLWWTSPALRRICTQNLPVALQVPRSPKYPTQERIYIYPLFGDKGRYSQICFRGGAGTLLWLGAMS